MDKEQRDAHKLGASERSSQNISGSPKIEDFRGISGVPENEERIFGEREAITKKPRRNPRLFLLGNDTYTIKSI